MLPNQAGIGTIPYIHDSDYLDNYADMEMVNTLLNEDLEMRINGRYILHEEIGRGAMGIVYRATDRLTGEPVALKQVIIEKAENDENFRFALAQEFQILAGLRHPYIISVLDYGFDAEKQPFFTMTYLSESQTILDAAHGASFERKIELVEQLLQGLIYLHRRGILHRDIKPENVLVTNGTVRLLDFGLSQNVDDEGFMGGSPTYMAPELIDGDPASVASDLYAVGVLLYQLATGQHPFGKFDTEFYQRLYSTEPNVEDVDPQIRPLVTQLLVKQPDQRPAAATIVLDQLMSLLPYPRPIESEAIRESYLQAAAFVGRETEMEQLYRALEDAEKNNGSAWLVGGESGVGKTRLLNELQNQALVNGFIVLRGQAIADSTGIPYQAWREPLRQLLLTAKFVDDLTASVLLQLVPDIPQLLERPVDPAPSLEGEAAKQRLFVAISALIWQSHRPILLILEDLQWAEESLQPILTLNHLINEHALLLVGTYRDDERPSLPEELPNMNVLSLPRFTDSEIASLSFAMLGKVGQQSDVLALIQQETEGNAFFAVEVVRALAEEVGHLQNIGSEILPKNLLPQGIQDVVQRRIDKMPAEGKPLLQLSAVAGRELDIRLIEAVADETDVKGWWLPLCNDIALLEVQDGRWRFSHDKIREGILRSMSDDTRKKHHRQIAEGLETVYPNDPVMAATLAFHWGELGEQSQELTYRLRAAEYAKEQYAYDDALAQWERAVHITSEDEKDALFNILVEQIDTLHSLGRKEQEARFLPQLTDLAESIGEPEKIIIAVVRQIEFQDVNGDYQASAALAGKTEERFKNESIHTLANLYCRWASSHSSQGQLEEGLEILNRVMPHLRGKNSSLESEALMILGNIYFRLGDHVKAFDAQMEALTLAEKMHLENKIITAHNNLAADYLQSNHLEQARLHFEAGLELNKRVGDQILQIVLLGNNGLCSLRLHDYHQFSLLTEQVVALARGMGNKINEAIGMENLGYYESMIGHFEEGLNYAQRSLEILEEIAPNDAYLVGNTWYVLAECHYGLGRWQEAEEAHQKSLGFRTERNDPAALTQSQAGLARSLLQTQDDEKAYITLQPVLAYLDHLDAAKFEHLFLYFVCYQILDANNRPEAGKFLQVAYQLVKSEAQKIEDDELRRFFYNEHLVHRDVIQIYNSLLGV